MIFAIMWAAN